MEALEARGALPCFIYGFHDFKVERVRHGIGLHFFIGLGFKFFHILLNEQGLNCGGISSSKKDVERDWVQV